MERESFGSRFGAIVVTAGSAVGLGNIWRFPYMIGANGGAAFIMVYILCLVFICLPILISEFVIGRRSNTNASSAFSKLSPGSRFWRYSGLLYVLSPTLVLSYYCVIGGWTIAYLFKPSTEFASFVSSNWWPAVQTVIFLLVTVLIVKRGVRKGIEKTSKVMMPLLFILVIIIAVRSLSLPGASRGVEFMFRPDPSKITPETCLAALGQAFFSLSIGCGVYITYGSYIRKDFSLLGTASLTAFFDFAFAIVAGLAVMPAVFAFGTNATEGTGLVFDTLPKIFELMPLGNVVSLFFFISLFLAALTSSMSQFEVPVSYLVEEKGLNRRTASLVVFIFAAIVGVFCALSFGCLSGIGMAGLTIFDTLDYICANFLMPLGGLLVTLFVGWRMKSSELYEELSERGRIKLPKLLFDFMVFLLRFIAPAGILAIFIFNLVQ